MAEHHWGARHLVGCCKLQRNLQGEQQGDPPPPVAILRGKVCSRAPLVSVTLRLRADSQQVCASPDKEAILDPGSQGRGSSLLLQPEKTKPK